MAKGSLRVGHKTNIFGRKILSELAADNGFYLQRLVK